MKYSIFLLALIGSTQSIAGTISSGGDPVAPPPPSEPFTYVCQVEVAEQTYVAGKTCYSEGLTQYTVRNQDLKVGGMLAPEFYVETEMHGWTPGHNWEGCPALPKSLVGHRIALVFNREKVNLSVTLVKDSENDSFQSSSDSDGMLSNSGIRAHTSLYRSSKNMNVSLDVNCVRSK